MIRIKSLLGACAIAALTATTTTAALAGDMLISKPWARASAGMAKAGGAFMFIYNETGHDDTLLSAKADIAKKVELHTHTMEGGMMRMRQVPSIPTPNGDTQMLQPGGYHVMFMGLHKPLVEGETFPLTLVFEKAGEITTTIEVMGADYKGDMMKWGLNPDGTKANMGKKKGNMGDHAPAMGNMGDHAPAMGDHAPAMNNDNMGGMQH